MDAALLLGSLAAILMLAAMARGLGLGIPDPLDEAAAMRVAEQAVAGFAAHSVALAKDNRAAVVTGIDGDIVLLKMLGARIAARYCLTPPHRHETPEGIEVDSGDRWFGRITLARPHPTEVSES